MSKYLVVWSGERLFLDRLRLVEGIDWLWLASEESVILVHESHGPRAGKTGSMLIREGNGADKFYRVTSVEHLAGDRSCPWKWVALKEVNLLDELRAAEGSLPS